MKKKIFIPAIVILIVVIIPFFYFPSSGDAADALGEEILPDEIPLPDTLKLIFVGDIMGHIPQIHAARHDGGDTTYCFDPTYQYVKDYIKSGDLSFANLEVTFGGTPYTGYPMFSCPHELAVGLKESGFDILFTANNHAADKGKKGIEATLDYINDAGFRYTGTFKDSLERADKYPLLVIEQGFRFAILNYTYDTNGLEVPSPNIVNLIDTVQIKRDLEKAKSFHPHYIITCMHWGYEYHSKESRIQRQQAQFLADHGTDLIIGSHPHVVQPFDYVVSAQGDSIPVIYSLGNFVSNQRDRYKDGGIAFEVLLEKDQDVVRGIHYAYEPVWVNKYFEQGKTRYRLVPVNDYLNDSTGYSLSESQLAAMKLFYEDTKLNLPNLPFTGFYGK